MDDSIRTGRDVEQVFGLPVLGEVSVLKGKQKENGKQVNLLIRGEAIDS